MATKIQRQYNSAGEELKTPLDAVVDGKGMPIVNRIQGLVRFLSDLDDPDIFVVPGANKPVVSTYVVGVPALGSLICSTDLNGNTLCQTFTTSQSPIDGNATEIAKTYTRSYFFKPYLGHQAGEWTDWVEINQGQQNEFDAEILGGCNASCGDDTPIMGGAGANV